MYVFAQLMIGPPYSCPLQEPQTPKVLVKVVVVVGDKRPLRRPKVSASRLREQEVCFVFGVVTSYNKQIWMMFTSFAWPNGSN